MYFPRYKAFVKSRNTITIRHNVYERLKRHGVFGESFSNLITRVLDEVEGGINTA